ncbi:MAG: hypothetical protein JST98_04765, partial [Bacteroidetes bacterium]|nr:hypothetical protein [Bacteroidota bacterium]
MLIALAIPVAAQTDVFPSSVDIRLVQGSTTDQLLVQVKTNSTAPFGGILSAMTVTIRYNAASGAALGAGTSFCSAWSTFPPSPVVTNGGIAYRTYNGFGISRLDDTPFNGGCGTTIPQGTWFTITTIPVTGSACTAFTLGNDAYTTAQNRNYYISMGGWDVTGQVVGGSINGGSCQVDCLGVPGGPALPGTACDDGNPNTTNDKWNTNCVCVGTPICTAPAISGTTSNSPICSGSALNLGVTASGTAPLAYAWTGTGIFSPNASSASGSVSGPASGTYQVTESKGCGPVPPTVAVQLTATPAY